MMAFEVNLGTDSLTRIGDDPQYFMGEGNLCARLGAAFNKMKLNDRTTRLHWISARVGRNVGTMKDLTVEEGENLLNYMKGL